MAQYVYGKNLIKRLIEDNEKIKELYITKDNEINKIIKNKNIKTIISEKKHLDKLSNMGNHQGVVALIEEYKTLSLSELLSRIPKEEKGLLVVLDGIEDPHNLGAILRTCDCAGVHGVIIKKNKAVGLTPVVAKVSSGAINTVGVASVINISQTLLELKDKGYWIYGSDIDRASDYREHKYDSPTVLVIGNEGKGISPLVKKHCDFMVKLPMVGKITSLNASVATGILLYEIFNKRFPL